jgi:hypothetical protein
MACHCFTWAGGTPACIGQIIDPFTGTPTVEACRAQCRIRGMAALCYAAQGECNSDDCTNGLASRCHFDSDEIAIIYGPAGISHLWRFYANGWIFCAPSSPRDWSIGVSDLMEQARAFVDFLNDVSGGEFFRLDEGRTLAFARCDWVPGPIPCSLTKTPCCLDVGTVRCKFIIPAQCISECGQPFEGMITWDNPTNPCALTGSNHPCNQRACCIQPYPPEFDLTEIGAAETYRHNSVRFCDVVDAEQCGRFAGSMNPNTRSCFEPGGCFGGSDPAHSTCVHGFWNVAYRPAEHKPPQQKGWLEGSAEIVSEKPERPMFPSIPMQCGYHYGDVAYSRDAESHGSAMGTICAQLPARRQTIERCPDYYATDWCPVMYGEDGNARFDCGYRVSTN